MAPTKRGSSANKKGKGKGKASAPPPPPPVLIRIHTTEELDTHVTSFQGSALLSVVTPVCTACTGQVVPALEKLNAERPADLKDTNLVVLYATAETSEVCRGLNVVSVPFFQSYSYGKAVESFSGDNMEKAVLITRIAVQFAKEEALRLAEEAKQLSANGGTSDNS